STQRLQPPPITAADHHPLSPPPAEPPRGWPIRAAPLDYFRRAARAALHRTGSLARVQLRKRHPTPDQRRLRQMPPRRLRPAAPGYQFPPRRHRHPRARRSAHRLSLIYDALKRAGEKPASVPTVSNFAAGLRPAEERQSVFPVLMLLLALMTLVALGV